MATVEIRTRNPLDCRGIPGIETYLFPGFNIGVPDTAYEVFKTHPILKLYLEKGEVDFKKSEPEVKGESRQGMLLADDTITSEPSPVILPETRKKVGRGDSN